MAAFIETAERGSRAIDTNRFCCGESMPNVPLSKRFGRSVATRGFDDGFEDPDILDEFVVGEPIGDLTLDGIGPRFEILCHCVRRLINDGAPPLVVDMRQGRGLALIDVRLAYDLNPGDVAVDGETGIEWGDRKRREGANGAGLEEDVGAHEVFRRRLENEPRATGPNLFRRSRQFDE